MYDITSGLTSSRCTIAFITTCWRAFSVLCSPDTSRLEVEKCYGSQICQLTSVTTLSKFLNEIPNTKFSRKEAKTSARVFTSSENCKMLEEKERKKKEALEE